MTKFEAVVMTISAVLLLMIMLIVVTDVFMRYVLNRPFSFTYDLVGLYLLAGLFFLSLSDTFRVGAHVSVDILVQHLPPGGRRASEIVSCLSGIPVFAAIAWLGWERAWDNWASNDVLAGGHPMANLGLRCAGAVGMRFAGAAPAASPRRACGEPGDRDGHRAAAPRAWPW